MKALSDQFRHCMKAALVVAFMKHCVSTTDFKSSSKSQIAACGHDCDSLRVMKKALYATQCRTVRKQSTKINLQTPERVILIRSRAYSKKIDNEEIIDILHSSCQLRPRSSANMLDSDSTLDTPGKGTKAFCQMPQAKADLALLKTTNVVCQDQLPVPLNSSNDLAKRELYKKDHVKEYTAKLRESSTNKELNDRKKILAILFPVVNKPLKSISKQSFLVPTSKPEAPSTRKTLCHLANRRLAEVGRSLPSLTRVHH